MERKPGILPESGIPRKRVLMKIFATVGTHPQQFNRLFRELDSLSASGKINAKIFAQTGNSDYKPKNFPFKKFINSAEYEKEFGKADAIVSHGGAGAIIAALKAKKPLVIVPRRKKFSEHTDDHQLDLAEALGRRGKAIYVKDLSALPEAIGKTVNFRPEKKSEKEMLVKRIEKFLSELD